MAYYKTESNVSLNENFTLGVSGMASSLKWKPTKNTAENVVLFRDGDGSYSSSYVTLDNLRKYKHLMPHIIPDFQPQSEIYSSEPTRLG